jgi:hypothetical protein
MAEMASAHEPDSSGSKRHRWSLPIRDLGLSIAGTALEPIVAEFEAELERVGIRRVRPRVYLSTGWGVCEGTVAIAIPFYLASPELTAIHEERVGHVEGTGRDDILRYLRHEMGHVVNYAYRLFETPEWVETFGSMDQPYHEEFQLEPFSRRFVRHLPGWYAQKHPDEDWAETFAVWMTPGQDWRSDYSEWPVAFAKLQFCDRTLAALAERDPIVSVDDLEDDVGTLTCSVEQFYETPTTSADGFPVGLEAALRSIFDDFETAQSSTSPRRAASALIARLERPLMADVYRWTGHFPERTRLVLRHLKELAESKDLAYAEDQEAYAIVSLTTLMTALAMNHVHKGAYFL